MRVRTIIKTATPNLFLKSVVKSTLPLTAGDRSYTIIQAGNDRAQAIRPPLTRWRIARWQTRPPMPFHSCSSLFQMAPSVQKSARSTRDGLLMSPRRCTCSPCRDACGCSGFPAPRNCSNGTGLKLRLSASA